MSIIFHSPIDDLIQSTLQLFPDLNAEIQLDDLSEHKTGKRREIKRDFPLGFTTYDKAQDKSRISVHYNQNVIGLLDIISHELAHAVCVRKGNYSHNAEWKEAYDRIYEAYNRFVQINEGGGAKMRNVEELSG